MKPKFKVKVSYFSSDSCLHDFNRKQEGNWSRFLFLKTQTCLQHSANENNEKLWKEAKSDISQASSNYRIESDHYFSQYYHA